MTTMNNKAYLIPGWADLKPNDVLTFDSINEAVAFTAERNYVNNLGTAIESPADANNYLNHLHRLLFFWGFHRLTPEQREYVEG